MNIDSESADRIRVNCRKSLYSHEMSSNLAELQCANTHGRAILYKHRVSESSRLHCVSKKHPRRF